MSLKEFYDKHSNFSSRTLSEYNISPGIKCKFDILKKIIGNKINFKYSLDIGCSGNSFLYFLNNNSHTSFLDLAINPLKQYVLDKKIPSSKNIIKFFHPINGDTSFLPYRDDSFNLIIMLDVLEHIKDDKIVLKEINRILKENGYLIITVPHRMKYYSDQDKIIGHYRRYELVQIIELLDNYNLKILKTFGVYGQLFRITEIQSYRPKEVEEQINKLRARYESKIWFRKLWDLFVRITSYFMRLEVKYLSINKVMNIGFVIKKTSKINL
ncbi:MAG: class I SAM-dependent methyltransferase [Candidatus Lokiarchaeota archaeon]|nr:class I SAM-dependent methyltransferase [Candidatus Lokiarchaeota archaeon]